VVRCWRRWRITAGLVMGLEHARVKALEPNSCKRQQDSGAPGHRGARPGALRRRTTQAREAAAKMALLEARVAETSMQRSQVEELIQSLARSRDENVLADVEAAIRVAMQQSAITGSAEPLVAALRRPTSAWPATTSRAWNACAARARTWSARARRWPWPTSPC
jgi:uroporphyrin-3 C-methyltransferase